MTTNLLQETISVLKTYKKTPEDVLWIGSYDVCFTWDNFAKIADIEYDSGFGGEEICRELIVAGSDWWMTRGEYDGSEWWDFHTKPDMPPFHIEPDTVTSSGWSSDYDGSCGELVAMNFDNDEELMEHVRGVKIKEVIEKDNIKDTK